LRYLLSVEIEIFSRQFRRKVWVEDRNLAVVTLRVDVKKKKKRGPNCEPWSTPKLRDWADKESAQKTKKSSQ